MTKGGGGAGFLAIVGTVRIGFVIIGCGGGAVVSQELSTVPVISIAAAKAEVEDFPIIFIPLAPKAALLLFAFFTEIDSMKKVIPTGVYCSAVFTYNTKKLTIMVKIPLFSKYGFRNESGPTK